ncbi:hypothetical protein EVAR_66862_1, partial [Eumeta japonica]
VTVGLPYADAVAVFIRMVTSANRCGSCSMRSSADARVLNLGVNYSKVQFSFDIDSYSNVALDSEHNLSPFHASFPVYPIRSLNFVSGRSPFRAVESSHDQTSVRYPISSQEAVDAPVTRLRLRGSVGGCDHLLFDAEIGQNEVSHIRNNKIATEASDLHDYIILYLIPYTDHPLHSTRSDAVGTEPVTRLPTQSNGCRNVASKRPPRLTEQDQLSA